MHKPFSFIGISNWALDMSTSNRAIFVARGNMNPEDLIGTCKSIYYSFFNQTTKLKEKEGHENYG
jgi:hypothetical protein